MLHTVMSREPGDLAPASTKHQWPSVPSIPKMPGLLQGPAGTVRLSPKECRGLGLGVQQVSICGAQLQASTS